MSSLFLNRVQTLQTSSWMQSLRGIKRGFEKECLRVDKNRMIAQSPHPTALGSSLTHPMITTDYAEALLEFVTPPASALEEPFNILSDLHQYTYHHLQDEILWAGSMPCHLSAKEEIKIADYGTSYLGRLKHIYRRGLGYRYGHLMQTIAGIHYNFSLSEAFWLLYSELLANDMPLQHFISEQYLGLIRNSLRFGWLLPLLFGASPGVSTSFFKEQPSNLIAWGKDSLIGPYATSLRLSDLGYHNRKQSFLSISYNSFTEFVYTMRQAVHTPCLDYTEIGIQKNGEYLQLNDNLLQTEDEHYALVRPKRVSLAEERMLATIWQQGIEYIEIRALDLNPFIAIGVEPDTLYFLDAFLLSCLLLESPPLTEAEEKRIAYNQREVAREGRQPKLCLMDETGKAREVIAWAIECLEMMQPAAQLLDGVYGTVNFNKAFETMKGRIAAPETLPSAQVLQEMKAYDESYCDFIWRWSLVHENYFKSKPMSTSKWQYYTTLSKDSIIAQKELEQRDKMPFAEYLQRYLAI